MNSDAWDAPIDFDKFGPTCDTLGATLDRKRIETTGTVFGLKKMCDIGGYFISGELENYHVYAKGDGKAKIVPIVGKSKPGPIYIDY